MTSQSNIKCFEQIYCTAIHIQYNQILSESTSFFLFREFICEFLTFEKRYTFQRLSYE